MDIITTNNSTSSRFFGVEGVIVVVEVVVEVVEEVVEEVVVEVVVEVAENVETIFFNNDIFRTNRGIFSSARTNLFFCM